MEPVLVFPDPPPPELAQTLDLAGYPWKAVSSPEAAARIEPTDGWSGAIVVSDRDPETAWALCRGLRKKTCLCRRSCSWYRALSWPTSTCDDLFDDFCLAPFTPELEARLRHCSGGVGAGPGPSFVEYGSRCCSTSETYRASIAAAR